VQILHSMLGSFFSEKHYLIILDDISVFDAKFWSFCDEFLHNVWIHTDLLWRVAHILYTSITENYMPTSPKTPLKSQQMFPILPYS
jgi:hypothetical protein